MGFYFHPKFMDEFTELLKKASGIDYYSLHLSGKNFNFRLLMAFGKEDAPIFLQHFMNVQGKGYQIIQNGTV